MLAAALSGCSGGGGLSTASILGTAPTPPPATGATPAAAPIAPPSSPTDRAFLVGSVSARATKCGFNFDAARIKGNFIASESARGTPPDQVGQLDRMYAIAYGGVLKAANEDPAYCSERKTRDIKEDLARLLAGDFEPRKALVAKAQGEDDSLFSGWFDSGSEDSGPSFGSGDWWEKQAEKAGGG
ncbi:MAG: hypothetical protein AB7S70_03785 [Hyphomicrobium sp.]